MLRALPVGRVLIYFHAEFKCLFMSLFYVYVSEKEFLNLRVYSYVANGDRKSDQKAGSKGDVAYQIIDCN